MFSRERRACVRAACACLRVRPLLETYENEECLVLPAAPYYRASLRQTRLYDRFGSPTQPTVSRCRLKHTAISRLVPISTEQFLQEKARKEAYVSL